MMPTVMLIGLIYQICEVYLDDVIVHATSEEEFAKDSLKCSSDSRLII